jgi:hypothetical protein
MLGVDAFHQPLEDVQRREPPHSAAIKAEQFEIPSWHLKFAWVEIF